MMKMESTGNVREAKRWKECRCIASPMGVPFERDGIYRWDYGRGCIIVFHRCGITWVASETEFAKHFQRLDGEAE